MGALRQKCDAMAMAAASTDTNTIERKRRSAGEANAYGVAAHRGRNLAGSSARSKGWQCLAMPGTRVNLARRR